MRTEHAQSILLAAFVGGAALLVAPAARASSPLEYPDNGSAAFSRGGAWLAVGNEPIAAHYNPAALATQASGFSLEQQLNFNKVCYDRRGPGNALAGPNMQVTAPDPSAPNDPTKTVPGLSYLPVCNERGTFPTTIPSISIAWRATERLGVGFAIVPPATYGSSENGLPATALGTNNFNQTTQQMPAPYRYMGLNNKSFIVFPTLSFGYEVLKHFRVGAGFVSGIGILNVESVSPSSLKSPDIDRAGDHMTDDGLAHLQTQDLFVPGVVASLHWSVLPELDLSVWGRWMDSIRTSQADVTITTQIYDQKGALQPTCLGDRRPDGTTVLGNCQIATASHFTDALTSFKFPIPPEVRLGARFHQPRTKSRMLFDKGGESRDPLHDDAFDVELDGSYSMNSKANTIEVRFKDNNGAGSVPTDPTGVPLPPNADRINGYKDSYGVRLGGQWNAIPDKLGVRAGGWFESQSMDPAYLSTFPVGATRWGFGGGLVLRQDFIDISIGYQRHQSAGLDNKGEGAMLAGTGTGAEPAFNLNNNIPGRTEFRSIHAVNGGHVTQSAHAFTLGGTVRF
jgi:long-chain fatty acid transport protein